MTKRPEPNRQRRLKPPLGRAWVPRVERWEQGFKHLRLHVDDYGTSRVHRDYKPNGYPLGKWVNDQRRAYAEGRLEPNRQRRLENLPGWVWSPRADRWELGFSHLCRYIDKHGSSRVHNRCISDGYALGKWVQRQRRSHADGRLDVERQHRLEQLPGWQWRLRMG